MASDFRKAFKGFGGATPDGNLPKVNDRDAPDGTYELEAVMSETFDSFESEGLSFKAEVIVHSCDNGRFKPGTHASIIIHSIDADKPFIQAKAQGNVKGLLAACLTNLDTFIGEDPIDAMDPSLPWEEEYVPSICEKGSTFLAGARFRLQTVGSVTKNNFKFKKLNFTAIQTKKAA
jgi:hypothetical protein